jgi:hypothetical protein
MRALGKFRRLLWLGIIAFLSMLSIPLFMTLFVEPAKTGSLLFYSAGNAMKVSDYVNFYYAGWMAQSPDRLHVYDPEVRMRTSNQLVAPNKLGEPLYTGYLPIVFPMMVPFALFDLTTSYFLWCAVTVSFGMTVVALFASRVMQWPPRYIITFCLYALWSLPGFLTLHLGQVVWLLLGLDLIFFCGLLRNKDIPAGIALAFATVKPQYSIPLLAAALGAKRWKLAGTAILTLAALFILAGITIGFDNVARYPTLLHHTEQSDLTARVMASIRPILYAVLPPAPALQASMAIWILTSLGIAGLWFISRDKNDATKRWLGALTILLALATSPHTHCHDLLLIAAAAVMTIGDERRGGTRDREAVSRSARVAAQIWLIILIIYPIAGFVFYVMPVGPHLSRWPFVLTNLILVALAAICYSANFRSGAVVSADDSVLA